MNRSSATADTRAASAALARLSAPEFDRVLVVDDSDEDATLIISVITERSVSTHNSSLEVLS